MAGFLAAAISAFLLAVPVSPPPAEADVVGIGKGLKPVAGVRFEEGTHLELARIKRRDYAFVAQYEPGTLRIIDVTRPERPRLISKLNCGGYQGNVQLSPDKKTLVLGLDEPSSTPCMPAGAMGFVTIDISNLRKPRAVGYAEIERGSHSLAVHPKKPFVYNADGFPEVPGEMQVWSIDDPARPKLVTTLDTGVHSPHDLSFNKDGSMAATANIVNFHLLDTSRPARPKIVATSQCPGCVHTHEARFTPDGKTLVVNDEVLVAPACPTGALYFYDISSGVPLMTGEYVQGDKVTTPHGDTPSGLCTSHVFDISDNGKRIAASWHEAGIKYLDISGTTGIAVGEHGVPNGPKEIGWYSVKDGDTFTTKLHRGPYIYAVDLVHGFQVFKVTA
jgi:hypothetical protein